MIRKAPFYKILSVIHIVFFTSILCFGVIFLTGTLLMLPALGAAFRVGKDLLYDELDVTNSIVALFFRYLKQALHLERFFPVSLMALLNILGIWAAARMENVLYSLVCMVILALLLTLSLYIAGYDTFAGEARSVADVVVAMFLKPLSVVTLLIVMILCVYFFSGTLAAILLFMGTFFLFVTEVVIFITMLYYLKLTEKLDEDDKYAYLVNGKRKK